MIGWISFASMAISTGLWMWSAFTPVRKGLDFFLDDLEKAAKRNAAASLFAAIGILLQAIDFATR